MIAVGGDGEVVFGFVEIVRAAVVQDHRAALEEGAAGEVLRFDQQRARRRSLGIEDHERLERRGRWDAARGLGAAGGLRRGEQIQRGFGALAVEEFLLRGGGALLHFGGLARDFFVVRFGERDGLGRGELVFVPDGDDAEVFHRFGALEDAGERVVILGGQGVELVVVTARAAHREAENRTASRVHLLVDDVHFHLQRIIFGEHLAAEREEAGGDERIEFFSFGGGGIFGEEIAGELFVEEAVVGFVSVEGADDVVAVTVGIGVGEVFIKAVRVRVARDIEPVAAPAFAVMR